MTKKSGIEKLIRPEFLSLTAYSARRFPETLAGEVAVPVENIIKLDANENPYGCSPRVAPALSSYPDLNIYPDSDQAEPRKLLAGFTGAGAEQIVLGSGSNQLIDLVARLFILPGDEVINCVPTFDLYRFDSQMCGATLVEVPRDEKFNVDVRAVKAAITKKTKLIFLANPNNPTGTLTPRQDIIEIADSGVPVLVDEAYVEFAGETLTPLVSRYENLMVLRTFSKWAGLAGLRVGYGIFTPPVASILLKAKIPYNVNVAALAAVRESLKDIDYLMGRVKDIIAERERLFEELSKLDFLKPYPSQANFIFCDVLKGEARDLWQKLEKRGILVRYFATPLLGNAIRISVGKPEHTAALLKALRELGGETGG
ncbi:histidinol-phosphate transaminase [Chloroflexota bacterium]